MKIFLLPQKKSISNHTHTHHIREVYFDMELSRTLPFNVLLLARVSEGNADSVNSLCSNAAFPISSSNLR